MQSTRNYAAVFGAFAVAIACNFNVPVQARPDAQLQPGTEAAEETIGDRKFQVARVVINATPTQVQGVLTDYSNTARMFSGVKSCTVVEDKGADKKIAFIASAPGNLWTFNYVLAVHETPGYIEWHRQSGSFKKNEGFWRLEALDNGRCTRVTYAKLVDAGLLPQALVTRELRASMPQILSNLKSNAESAQFAGVVTDPRTN